MSNPQATIIDGITGQVVERPLTSLEIADQEATQSAFLQSQADYQAKELARKSALAKLAALGLTEAEIAAL
jgi:hypothetical protein